MLNTYPTGWHKSLILCRVGFICLGAALLGSSVTLTVAGQNREDAHYAAINEETIKKLENHTVMIGMLSTNVKELSDTIKEQSAQLNTLKGMFMGFGALLSILQIIQFLTDKKLKFVEPKKDLIHTSSS